MISRSRHQNQSRLRDAKISVPLRASRCACAVTVSGPGQRLRIPGSSDRLGNSVLATIGIIPIVPTLACQASVDIAAQLPGCWSGLNV
jgi:hypothetical protein